jgi:hypothetical protein
MIGETSNGISRQHDGGTRDTKACRSRPNHHIQDLGGKKTIKSYDGQEHKKLVRAFPTYSSIPQMRVLPEDPERFCSEWSRHEDLDVMKVAIMKL